MNARPAVGSGSVISTLFATSGPLFVTSMVKVMMSPTFGYASFTDLFTRRSASRVTTVADPLLFVRSGSN